jgi:hypothetical protein
MPVTDGSIRLDGRLDEDAWQLAVPAEGFVQRDPEEGRPARNATEVRFIYDGHALYVGARMSGARLQAPLGRRDSHAQADHVLVSLDTFHDRRTAYAFGVTAAGVRLDRFNTLDSESEADQGFDPVWEARVSIEGGGWTAEMKIPFSQLRFSRADEQTWGLNIQRFVPTANEQSYWVLVPKTETGWSSRFGVLSGIRGVKPSRRIETWPYAAAQVQKSSAPDLDDPFAEALSSVGRLGLDAKMGLGPNLTLEATVNPDFGQVEADAAEVNLTAFETYFPEKRPFFTEGGRLLEGEGPGYYYSRRIGAAPQVSPDTAYSEQPAMSTILAAAKLTGRLPSGTSIGALAALTDDEWASTFDPASGAFAQTRVAPLTGWGVVRAQREIGASASTVGLVGTGVWRSLGSDQALSAELNRSAFSGGADWNLRFRGGKYAVRGHLGASRVDGAPEAIAKVQQTSARYFQRPDVGYVRFDPGRTSLVGWSGMIEAAKEGGSHWLGFLRAASQSPGFELNDMGRLRQTDERFVEAQVRYRETKPKGIVQGWSVGAFGGLSWNFGNDLQDAAVYLSAQVTWANFWRTVAISRFEGRSQDQRLTRGGPSMGVGRQRNGFATFSGNPASRVQWSASLGYQWSEEGLRGWDTGPTLSIRPGQRWSLGVTPYFISVKDPRQFVSTIEGGSAETYGTRYVFGTIDREILSVQVRFGLTLKPDLDLDVYAEPFADSGRYLAFGELLAPRSRDLRMYGTGGTAISRQPDGSYAVQDGTTGFTLPSQDYRVLSFRSNVVLRWEWRRGSTLYVVWQRSRGTASSVADPIRGSDLVSSFSAPGDDVFLVKASVMLPRP